MSGSCPYCGAKLNYGIKFCVVCGRPITGQDSGKTSKMGSGMRSGIRPADVTRRLDDLMTVARFKHSKRTTTLDSNMRWVSLNFVSVALGIALFFCAVKISLDGGLVKKSDKAITPLAAILTKLGLDGIGKKSATEAVKPPAKVPNKKSKSKKTTNKKSH
ncbi:MAG: hypothetical protein Q8T09_07235 [Candidatus Melainabacteria bacterium]|nr:hypothetical protein [Candidatus Melainabacteria bacterium]